MHPNCSLPSSTLAINQEDFLWLLSTQTSFIWKRPLSTNISKVGPTVATSPFRRQNLIILGNIIEENGTTNVRFNDYQYYNA